MPIEIERKYLINNELWKNEEPHHAGVHYSQGYLCASPERTVRVRIAGDKAFITIKGQTIGFARPEFEYDIPVADALLMLKMCVGPLIEKKRYKVEFASKLWEVDVFEGDNQGLTIAEIELKSTDETFELPPWIGQEVTGDKRYYNSYLSKNPFNNWI
jgi:CYTH domain-containing protein